MAYELALSTLGIPYKVIGQTQFFSRKEIKDVKAWINILTKKPDELDDDWLRIINVPNRYLGEAFKNQLHTRCKTDSVMNNLKLGGYSHGYMNRGAMSLHNLIAKVPEFREAEHILEYIYGFIGYKNHCLKNIDMDSTADSSSVEEVLDELMLLARRTTSIGKFVNILNSHDNENALVELMTIHKSKGLEADTVFVVGLCDDILPHALAEDVDEEQRLLYVAITRARNNLILSYPAKYNNRRRSVTRFIYLLKEES
jgi:DNA helicase-2/ATP-dependent DNA helicase PcrA